MNLATACELRGYGTSEGVLKEWDERGRGRHEMPEGAPHGDWTDNIEAPQVQWFKNLASMMGMSGEHEL